MSAAIGNEDAIDHLIYKMESFDAKLEDYGEQVMDSDEVRRMLEKMNVDQLNQGKRADNGEIYPTYAPRTVEIKKKKGQEYNFVTLRDTGEFQGGIRALTFRDKVELISEDSKSDDLQAKYKPSILGIDDENMYAVRDFLKPKFIYFARYTLTL